MDEFLIEIVDDLHQTGDSDLTVVGEESPKEHQFIPLNKDDCKQVSLKFGLALNNTNHLIQFKGVGKKLPNPPVVTIAAKPDGGMFIQFTINSVVRQRYLCSNFVPCAS